MASPYYNAGYPVVVQGQPVSNAGFTGGNVSNYNSQQQNASVIPSQNHAGADSTLLVMDQAVGSEWTRGTPQPRRCRDVFWAILFYIHIGAIISLAFIYTPRMVTELANKTSTNDDGQQGRRLVAADSAWQWLSFPFQDVSMPFTFHRFMQEQGDSSTSNSTTSSFDANALLVALSVCGLLGLIISSFALVIIMNFAAGLIKIALVFHVVFMVVLAVFALLTGNTGLCILLFIGAGLSLCFTVGAWSRIPFGAANLTTAVTAVRANLGLAFFAYLSLIMSFLWSIGWSLAAVSTVFVLNGCNSSFQCSDQTPAGTLILFLLLLSYHWTSQVIFNVVHVTTAGTVGTWWFAPHEASACCSKAIGDSYIRSMTSSFGSICLGSLIVSLIEATRDLLRNLRDQNDSMLACLADCCLGCLESWAEYFCKWAYVYVGLYGYGFIEASQGVLTLFRSRGWTTIITDSLVETVLSMVALAVGALTGILGLVIGVGMNQQGQDNAALIFFLIGFVVGWVMCATLFSIVSSAVNTVIVCYAEAPNEFQVNHPQLSTQMRAAWRQAWPVEFHY